MRAGSGFAEGPVCSSGRKYGHAIAGILAWAWMSKRIELLKNMLEQDPGSAFARYGLAMEYTNAGELENAMAEFLNLLASNPDYAAGYFHGGRTLEKLGRLDQAREMYERGIAVTTRSGDGHTRSELQAALDMLG